MEGTGPNTFTTGYNHVVLTVAANGLITGYLNGLADFSTTTSLLNLDNNPTRTMNIFLDDAEFGGEFSSGKISQFRLYDGVLTPAEALSLSQTGTVPEPSTAALFGIGLFGWLAHSRPRRKALRVS